MKSTEFHGRLAASGPAFDLQMRSAGMIAFPHWYEHRSLVGRATRAECEACLSHPAANGGAERKPESARALPEAA